MRRIAIAAAEGVPGSFACLTCSACGWISRAGIQPCAAAILQVDTLEYLTLEGVGGAWVNHAIHHFWAGLAGT
jgi:hypothetical protein